MTTCPPPASSRIVSTPLDAAEESRTHLPPFMGLRETPYVNLRVAIEHAVANCAKLKERIAAAGLTNLDLNVKSAIYAAEDLLKSEGRPTEPDVSAIAAVHLYTQESPLYCCMNNALREKQRDAVKPFYLFLKLLCFALSRAPRRENVCILRGVQLSLHREFDDERTITWWALSSCTKNLPTVKKFTGPDGPRTIFHVETDYAFDVSCWTACPEEEEFLLPCGVELKVLSKVDMGNDLWMIHLKQIGPPLLFDLAGTPLLIAPSPPSQMIAAERNGPTEATTTSSCVSTAAILEDPLSISSAVPEATVTRAHSIVHAPIVKTAGQFFCDICQVDVLGEENWHLHVIGKQHRKATTGSLSGPCYPAASAELATTAKPPLPVAPTHPRFDEDRAAPSSLSIDASPCVHACRNAPCNFLSASLQQLVDHEPWCSHRQPGGFHCAACGVPVCGADNWAAHTNSARHMRKVQLPVIWLPATYTATSSAPPTSTPMWSSPADATMNSCFRCDLCGVTICGPSNYLQHLEGAAHRRREGRR